MELNFSKYQGTGNDFVIIDNRKGEVSLSQNQVAFLCDRRFGIGADGLMLLQVKEGYDFEMVYYNSDGNVSSMCGNGGRCISAFAKQIGIEKDLYKFLAIDGEHFSKIEKNDLVNLQMTNVESVESIGNDFYLNTGSPHYVMEVNDVADIDLISRAHKVRYNSRFKEEGTNVNFIQKTEQGIKVRTYERGVENETLSCGTGVTACAIVSNLKNWTSNICNIESEGGSLEVSFQKGEEIIQNIWLKGAATFVFKGNISV